MSKYNVTIGMVGVRGVSADQIGGIEAVVTELSNALTASHIRCNVYVRESVLPRKTKNEYLRVIKILRLPTKHFDTITYSLFASIHAAYSCQVVHYHGVGPALLCWIPRLMGKKVIVTVHGADWRREKWNKMARLSLLSGAWIARFFAQEITAVSQPCADETSVLIGRHVKCIPNGLIVSRCEENAEYKVQFKLDRREYYLFLGRLVPEKRVDLLLNAFRNLKTRKKLVIAGDAPYGSMHQEELKSLASRDPRVLMVGSVSGGCKAGLLNNAYCLILPSMIEGHAMVILEAVDASVPVLCSDIPENLFAICADGEKHGTDVGGLVFRAGDQDALVSAMELAEAQPKLLTTMSQIAKKCVTEKFNWEEIMQQYKDLYISSISV